MSALCSPLKSSEPLIYLITAGTATAQEFDRNRKNILQKIRLAAEYGLELVQIREKSLPAKLLFELVRDAVALTRDSNTLVLVNERFDIALAASADGVQLTSNGLSADLVRRHCPAPFLIGVSTHSCKEAENARGSGADFALFGPVFRTPSKSQYGEPKGISELRNACEMLNGFPIIAVGGINSENSGEVVEAGASGYAAIRLFEDEQGMRNARL